MNRRLRKLPDPLVFWGCCSLAVLGMVGSGEAGIRLWNNQSEQLRLFQLQRTRLQGWLTVQETLGDRMSQLLGDWSHLDTQERYWRGVQAVQETAQLSGLSIDEVRPLERSSRRGDRFSLDVRLVGKLSSMSRFLERLPEKIPQIHLESLQWIPRKDKGLQGTFRLSFPSQAVTSEGIRQS